MWEILIFLQIKVYSGNKKQNQVLNQHFSSSLPHAQLHSRVLYLTYHHPGGSIGEWGIGGYCQSLVAAISCSFLFTVLLSSSKGPSHGLQFLKVNLQLCSHFCWLQWNVYSIVWIISLLFLLFSP